MRLGSRKDGYHRGKYLLFLDQGIMRRERKGRTEWEGQTPQFPPWKGKAAPQQRKWWTPGSMDQTETEPSLRSTSNKR